MGRAPTIRKSRVWNKSTDNSWFYLTFPHRRDGFLIRLGANQWNRQDFWVLKKTSDRSCRDDDTRFYREPLFKWQRDVCIVLCACENQKQHRKSVWFVVVDVVVCHPLTGSKTNNRFVIFPFSYSLFWFIDLRFPHLLLSGSVPLVDSSRSGGAEIAVSLFCRLSICQIENKKKIIIKKREERKLTRQPLTKQTLRSRSNLFPSCGKTIGTVASNTSRLFDWFV